MSTMRDVFPKFLVKFEDFSTDNAFKYLDAFQNRAFNDDVSSRFARSFIHLIIPLIDPRHWGRNALRPYQPRSYCLCCVQTPFGKPLDIILRCRVSWSWWRKAATLVLYHQRAELGGSKESYLRCQLQKPDYCGQNWAARTRSVGSTSFSYVHIISTSTVFARTDYDGAPLTNLILSTLSSQPHSLGSAL